MSKRFPFFLALGAGAAFVAVWNERRREEKSLQWDRMTTHDGQGTALITGASAGIGAAYARALARLGYNLVLLARREDRLKALAEEITTFNPVQVETLVADLSSPADLERAASRISEIPDLTLLVNNAGFGTRDWFVDSPASDQMKMIQVHVVASERLMHAALQGMVARKRGAIINVASMAGLLPMPGTATYGATKSYLIFFTQALSAELTGSGVRLQALCPGFTHSEFHQVAGEDMTLFPEFMWQTAEQVVAESLQGLREDRVVVIPGRVNRTMALAMKLPGVTPIAHLVQQQRLARHEQRMLGKRTLEKRTLEQQGAELNPSQTPQP